MRTGRFLKSLFACAASLTLLPGGHGVAQQPGPPPGGSAAAAGEIADFFRQVGDQIYEDCIFELSQEQLEVQQALIEAYIKQGAPSAAREQLAVKQIQPPEAVRQVRADQEPRRKPDASGCGHHAPRPPKKPAVVAAVPKAEPETARAGSASR